MKKFIKDFVKSSKFKAFIWTTVNGFIILLISGLADVSWEFIPFLIAGLNFITKYINNTILPKYSK